VTRKAKITSFLLPGEYHLPPNSLVFRLSITYYFPIHTTLRELNDFYNHKRTDDFSESALSSIDESSSSMSGDLSFGGVTTLYSDFSLILARKVDFGTRISAFEWLLVAGLGWSFLDFESLKFTWTESISLIWEAALNSVG